MSEQIHVQMPDVEAVQSAAEQGDVEAQYTLGLIHIKGQGVPQSYQRAVDLYHQAARKGHPKAQFHLGVIYRYGEGVPQDYVRAYMWWHMAAAVSHDARDARDRLVQEMTPQNVAEAKAMVRSYLAG